MDKFITVIIPTSPLKIHPNTSVIDETIASIRHHLPEAEIIVTFDGIREEQQDLVMPYTQYKKQMLWKFLREDKRILPFIFKEHKHQSDMLRAVISEIKTPLLLYVEADAPLVTDEKIDWKLCIDMIMNGDANTIRFHHEAQVPTQHNHLMLKTKGKFIQTIQWSQRPHLSSVVYYRDTVLPKIPAKSFIEDTFHGTVQGDYYEDGFLGWAKHRLWIYIPDEKNIKRSYHLDGRAGGKKFTSDDEVWQ